MALAPKTIASLPVAPQEVDSDSAQLRWARGLGTNLGDV